jgi:hypothetical protein
MGCLKKFILYYLDKDFSNFQNIILYLDPLLNTVILLSTVDKMYGYEIDVDSISVDEIDVDSISICRWDERRQNVCRWDDMLGRGQLLSD